MTRLIIAAGIAGAIWLSSKFSFTIGKCVMPQINAIHAFVIALTLYITSGGYYTLWIIYKTAPRDLRGLYGLIQIKRKVGHARRNNLTIPKLFMKNVAKNPNRVALIFEDKQWTFTQLDEYSNRVANSLLARGYKHGDVVALFMENRMEYVGTWLGCAKVGMVAALINFNLRQRALIHSIKVASSQAIISGAEHQQFIKDVYGDFDGMPVFVSGLNGAETINGDWVDFNSVLHSADPTPSKYIDEGNFDDNLLYIYTSGTTGLPKAAIIKHSRFLFFSTAVHVMTNLTEEDRLYNPLPLYHTAGGMVGMGQVLIYGSSAVIRKKFSVTNYWPEAAKHGCTVGQYVGEICRYLLNTPPRPEDKMHKVRVMYGNGVRPQIWEEFTKRFNIPCIAEFYGATESNANIINYEGKPGACGFLSVIARGSGIYPACLIRVDETTGVPVRDKNGLCIQCNPGESGEFIGRIQKNDAVGDFHGYADKAATEKKIARDVFKKGDYAFLSGDILTMDELGYIYFKDRLGDTFRWRGENVSTTEVEGVISVISDHKDAVVYGVEVPFTEGKAGMAAIVDPNEDLDILNLAGKLSNELAAYARPLFVRVLKEIDTTGTFKLKKLDLQKDGFDIHTIKDKIFILDGKQNKYVTLSEEIYNKILGGKMGL